MVVLYLIKLNFCFHRIVCILHFLTDYIGVLGRLSIQALMLGKAQIALT